MNKNLVFGIVLTIAFMAGIALYFFDATPAEESMPDSGAVSTLASPPTDSDSANDGIINFALDDIDGNRRELSEWHGKAQLVNFWATWCAPCRREIPLLKKMQEEHAEDNLQVIGIAVDFRDAVVAYAEEVQFNYPILIGQEDAMAAAESSGVDFIGLPFTMVIAPSGELLKTHIGEIVEDHIELIVDVFAALENGSMDIAGARAALSEL